MSERPDLRLTWALTGLALCLFGPLFAIRGFGAFDFWWWMSADAVVLLGLVGWLDPEWRRELRADLGPRPLFKVVLGLTSAVVLYGVFFAGNWLSRRVFPFAAGGIDAIYGFKNGASLFRVGLLIVLLIGPAEELFWRGFLQRRLAARHGRLAGLVAAAAVYTLMHLGSLNPMLILAAAVCGLFWGWLYLRFGSLLLNVTSHVVWDATVFLLLPFGRS